MFTEDNGILLEKYKPFSDGPLILDLGKEWERYNFSILTYSKGEYGGQFYLRICFDLELISVELRNILESVMDYLYHFDDANCCEYSHRLSNENELMLHRWILDKNKIYRECNNKFNYIYFNKHKEDHTKTQHLLKLLDEYKLSHSSSVMLNF